MGDASQISPYMEGFRRKQNNLNRHSSPQADFTQNHKGVSKCNGTLSFRVYYRSLPPFEAVFQIIMGWKTSVYYIFFSFISIFILVQFFLYFAKSVRNFDDLYQNCPNCYTSTNTTNECSHSIRKSHIHLGFPDAFTNQSAKDYSSYKYHPCNRDNQFFNEGPILFHIS